ncbi:MAG TPA: LacI family DNA-binding transcriptional regulator [Anaerolineales bacterium]|nr:LacI family DNA-binding transcriptional regulator [Anaerolineales bacterium]
MPLSKRVTSLDVAKKAGVSRTTVSFVLNKVPGVSISAVTRNRVLKVARDLNYHPNEAGLRLASGKSRTVGLILYQSPEQVFADALLPQVILGVEQAAIQHGFHVLLKAVEPKDPTGYARLIGENHVDGILLSGPRRDDREIIRLHREGVPIMLMGQLPNTDIPFADIDATAGAALAVNHLIECGHRRIALITNAPLSYTSARQRRAGYLKALKHAKLPAERTLVKEGAYTPSSGFEAMTALLALSARQRPSAVFVASDVVAVGAMLAIKSAGLRIPQDIALVGFDDIPLAEYFDPPLTTIRLPAYGLGWAAAERLIRLIRGEGLDQHDLLMNSEIIVRTSTQKS